MPRPKKLGGKKISGELLRPIKCSPPPVRNFLTQTQEEYEVQFHKWRATFPFEVLEAHLKKLPALLKHYDLPNDESKWVMLTLRLAADCVPGFAVDMTTFRKRGAGRPEKWSDKTLARLYRDVEAEKSRLKESKRPCRNTNACLALSKKEPWASMGNSKKLYNRYMESKNSLIVQAFKEFQNNPKFAHGNIWEQMSGFLERE